MVYRGVKHGLIVLLALVASVLCTRNNPFESHGNAGVYTQSRSLYAEDTLDIFSSETLSVLFEVKELLDSVKYTCSSNRFWPEGDTSFTRGDFRNDPVELLISMHDTGRICIKEACFKTDGSVARDSFYVYSGMSIDQGDISFSEGDSVVLFGGEVDDNGVIYNWSFGTSVKYTSLSCSLKVAVNSVLFQGDGLFWIEGSRFSSPKDSFDFTVDDTSAPDIICVNTNNVGEDTIITGDSIFNFQVRITDNGKSVDSTLINGGSFDYSSQGIYYKLLTGLEEHTRSDPLNLVVYAIDNFTFGNETTEIFTVIYSDSAVSLSPVEINIRQPSVNPYIVSSDSVCVTGDVVNNTLDPFGVVLSFGIHDTVMYDTLYEEGEIWEWCTGLDTNVNFSSFKAYDLDGDVLDSANLSIIYEPEAEDTIPPRIMSLEINGKDAGGYYTKSTEAVLDIQILEHGSGIESVSLNGENIISNSSGNRCYDTLQLQHLASGNEIHVTVSDSEDNTSDSTIVVFHNTKPLVTWPESDYIAADSLYTDTVVWGDQDGDTVSFSLESGPEGLSVDSTGLVSWVPGEDDIGKNRIQIRAWDGFQPVYNTYTLYVTSDGEPPPGPVEFKTGAKDFPEYLEAGRDTLSVEFQIKDGTGIPPFRYTVNHESADSLIMEGTEDSVLTWMPSISDTGYSEFSISVVDEFPSVDMFYAVVPVVVPNRPFTVVLDYNSDTLPNGAVDLNTKQAKDTLLFRIQDPDSIITERYHIKILQTSTNTLSEMDSVAVDSFQYVLDPYPVEGYDTLVVSARDKDYNTDTLNAAVYYGLPPEEPQPVAPVSGDESIDPGSVVLRWSCSDPDNDSLTYEVFFGSSENTMVSYGEMAQDSLSITGLSPNTEYYWSVTVSDWKSSVQGGVWNFRTVF